MTVYTVKRPKEEVSEREYGVVTIRGSNYRVFRTSPLFGDSGYGAVTVDGETYTVYRATREDGDIGYGVIDVKKKAKKKTFQFQGRLPDDLAEIVSAWSELPEDLKSKIEALIKSNMKGSDLNDADNKDG